MVLHHQIHNPVHIMKPYPIATGATCKRMPAALVFTKNIKFVDDLVMFQDLKWYMQSNGCHAVFLSALDISIKHGIGGCLRSLYRQLVSEASDVVDVPLIASWYCKYENYHKLIVVIIDDMERCDGTVLADFIKMLSEWVMRIPIIFMLGVTTTFDALRKLLPSSVMHNMQLCKFTLESPGRRMDSLIQSILVRSCSGFLIGHKEDYEAFWTGKCGSLTEVLRSYAFDFPSCQRVTTIGDNNLAQGLSELKWLQNSY